MELGYHQRRPLGKVPAFDLLDLALNLADTLRLFARKTRACDRELLIRRCIVLAADFAVHAQLRT